MINFRTELNLPPASFSIKHDDLIMLIGSCFSNNIGSRLQNYKFNSICNPFGTVFHPVSIARLIEYALQLKVVAIEDLQLSQGVFVHCDFHSNLGSVDNQQAVHNINLAIAETHEALKRVKYLFITLGTSIGYSLKSTDTIVANCHKLPSEMFAKANSSIEMCENALANALSSLFAINNDVHVIMTVSPVRHTKDGIIENARSKAKLLSVAENLQMRFENVSYFPAYEWMMDDLRDYRFYEKDLIHPNEQAIDYIWEKFEGHYFDGETTNLNKKIGKIIQQMNHRPFNVESTEYQYFMKNLETQKSLLQSAYPWIQF
ncbi:MAG: GSCFA domain-containing protein [Saprospiraceae bacterium]